MSRPGAMPTAPGFKQGRELETKQLGAINGHFLKWRGGVRMNSIGTAENNWIKLYESVLDDPDLQEMPAEHFRLLVNCWLLAHRYGNKLGTIRQISFRLHLDGALVAEAIDNLKDYFKCSDGTYGVAKWDVWQTTQTSTDRARKSREKKKQENDLSSCNSLTDATLATIATIATNDATHATSATNGEAAATIATIEKKRREENKKEEIKGEEKRRFEDPTAPLIIHSAITNSGPDPDELFQAAAKFACEHLPAGGDVGLTASAMRSEFQKSASFEGNPDGFCLSFTASVRKWRAAYDANPDLRTKQAQWWTRDGTYSQAPPAPRAPRRFGPVDLKAGLEVEDAL